MKKVLVPLADGVEEIEAVIIVDILRRAAWQVAAVTIAEDIVEGSRGIKLCADCKWPEIDPDDYDMIVLAGGMQGATNLAADPRILRTIRNFADAGKVVVRDSGGRNPPFNRCLQAVKSRWGRQSHRQSGIGVSPPFGVRFSHMMATFH